MPLSNLIKSMRRVVAPSVVAERSKGWKIYTRSDYAGFVKLLFPGRKPERLSPPAMETLAIIAYRQPVTKSALEAVRGVSCDGMLQKLLDRELMSKYQGVQTFLVALYSMPPLSFFWSTSALLILKNSPTLGNFARLNFPMEPKKTATTTREQATPHLH